MPGCELKFVSLNTMKPPAGMLVPFGTRNFLGVAASSLKNQPPTSTFVVVELNNSIASNCGGSVCVRISLITMDAMFTAGSSAPGEPPRFALGRQLEDEFGSPLR